MSFTSAQSGDNYRNWWPHPTMTDFTNDSIDLMEEIARATSNLLKMTRRGYLLATRQEEIDGILAGLHSGYRRAGRNSIRVHRSATSTTYDAHRSGDWQSAPAGVDVLANHALIRQTFPSLSKEIANVVHIRRGGDIDSQQLGQYMLQQVRSLGGRRVAASVRSIAIDRCFIVEIRDTAATRQIRADIVVNAAGPFAAQVASMLGVELPVENVYQQKIAFDDNRAAIPRRQPFSVDLDDFEFSWPDEDRRLLSEDAETRWLTGRLPGGVHCRPEGGARGSWVKLGWAFNREVSEPQHDLANEPRMHQQFPEIAMRAAARLHPSLAPYLDNFPARYSHYGGYYPMTRENWPIIGPLGVDGAFIAGALSGFGSMAACAAGALCADWICGGELPSYASRMSLERISNAEFMAALRGASSKGLL
jgi:glycine/D-amino acid oxidase-like deaminating enzyme